MAYATVADLKAYKGFSEDVDDVLLAALLERASGVIEAYSGRRFEKRRETRKYNPLRDVQGRVLFLDEDLLSVSSLKNGNGEVIPPSAFVLLPINETPKRAICLLGGTGYVWTFVEDPEGAILVEGDWGYSETPPSPIVHACIRLAAYFYDQKDAGVYDVKAIPEAGTIVLPQGIPKDVALTLSYFRHRAVL